MFGEWFCITDSKANFSFTAVSDEDNAKIDVRNIGKKVRSMVSTAEKPEITSKVITMCVSKEVFNECREIWEKTGAKLEIEAKAKHDFYIKVAKDVGPSKKAKKKIDILEMNQS